MKPKIHALEQNHTWQLTPLPIRKRVIECKCVYKTKLRADGSVESSWLAFIAIGGIEHAKSVSTLFPQGLKLSSESSTLFHNVDSYKSSSQLADLFTKVPVKSFELMLSKLGLASLDPNPTFGRAVEIDDHLQLLQKSGDDKRLGEDEAIEEIMNA
ncbi:hypothetical protein Sango_0819200 [Sesamum angolense]|uniref:Uncharacterized protein n=1 Tax=Sesamum angolense TaxID=2727404 RepID=A0AAE1X3N5_9LAMI|nr:hypothetical protein Sango_0819200 [Sesamum angolense]